MSNDKTVAPSSERLGWIFERKIMSYETELESPLRCTVLGGVLRIEVGLNRLNGNERHPTISEMDILSPRTWGKDVIRELEREEEDGSSPLGNLLDEAIIAARDFGSTAIREKSNAEGQGCRASRHTLDPLVRHSDSGGEA